MITSTFASRSSWTAPPVDDAAPLAEAGQARDPAHEPPSSSASASTRWTRRNPRLPSTIAHSIPAGPGADDEHVAVGVRGRLEALGVPAAAVLLAGGRVLRAAEVVARSRHFEMQMLQPMHSRISP